jgi:hypothetical protein
MTWQPVAEWLRDQGHAAIVPSLAGVWAGGAPYYPRLVERALARRPPGMVRLCRPEGIGGRGAVTVVLHSGAGALAPTVAAALPGSRMIFVDALLPHPGQSWFDTAPADLRAHLTDLAVECWLPPWDRWFPAEVIRQVLPDTELRRPFTAELEPMPLAYFREVAPPLDVLATGGYVRLSAGYDTFADASTTSGWPVIRADLDHLAVLTRPVEVAELVITLSAQLG